MVINACVKVETIFLYYGAIGHKQNFCGVIGAILNWTTNEESGLLFYCLVFTNHPIQVVFTRHYSLYHIMLELPTQDVPLKIVKNLTKFSKADFYDTIDMFLKF